MIDLCSGKMYISSEPYVLLGRSHMRKDANNRSFAAKLDQEDVIVNGKFLPFQNAISPSPKPSEIGAN